MPFCENSLFPFVKIGQRGKNREKVKEQEDPYVTPSKHVTFLISTNVSVVSIFDLNLWIL